MKQHYTDEKTGISYTLQGDYYLPDLILPAEKEERHIGIWGQRHAKYLEQNHTLPPFFSTDSIGSKFASSLRFPSVEGSLPK